MPRGLILQPTSRVRGGRAVIQLFGKLDSGVAFLIEDDRFRPYFFVPADDRDRIGGGAGVEISDPGLRALNGEPVLQVTVRLPGDVPALRERIERAGGRTLEADLRFAYRYLVDHGIRATLEIDGDAQTTPSGMLRFHNPTLRPAECDVSLRVLSLDLETNPDASRVICAALVGADAGEVHVIAPRPVRGAQVYADEAALLAAVNARFVALDPDVIVGWNVVDFDLRVWDARCQANGLRAELGRTPGGIRFQQDLGFSRNSRAEIPGRIVLDGIPLVRDAVKLPDYRLETVARERLGRGKLIDAAAPDKAAEIARLHRDDPEALVAYNRQDAQLVLDILEHERLLGLTLERSLLSGMQLDRVGASIACFDRLYLPELRRRGRVAPSVARERPSAGVRGGALLEPQPGYFRNVAVFDWKSLYPSLIRTFQLDPLAHAEASRGDLEAPNGARFKPDVAILPEVIERFMERRDAAKQRGDRHADQAITIMMNSLFGVLGAPSCRFFDPAIANAITSFGQQTLHWTRDAFLEAGIPVLYGDTDSVFVELGDGDRPGALAAAELRMHVQTAIDARIAAEYGVESKLVLELEVVFDRFFLPFVRGGRSGSKKRYAGWSDGQLQLVGLEAIRSDWPSIAGQLQRGALERVFADRDPIPFVKQLVERVRGGELDAELVYTKRVRKASLDKYTATTPPHVQAARKLGSRAGPVVRYVITTSGPEPVEWNETLPGEIDYRHYVEKVLRPIAEAILAPLDLDFDAATGNPRQMRLL